MDIQTQRAVERLYWNRTNYLRPFVSKAHRQPALATRACYMRMEAMMKAIEQFAQEPATNKVVVSLHCGYAPYAFRTLDTLDGVSVVDIDRPEVTDEKVKTIISSQLAAVVGQAINGAVHPRVSLCTARYAAVSCDLDDLDLIRDALYSLHKPTETHILFLSDSLDNEFLRFSTTLSFASVTHVVGGSIAPAGLQHPYAICMARGLAPPSRSLLLQHPTLSDQITRFQSHGLCTSATDLYSFWLSLDSFERQRVESAEPFDDWEDLVLFGQHHFILHATNFGHKSEAVHADNQAKTADQALGLDLQVIGDHSLFSACAVDGLTIGDASEPSELSAGYNSLSTTILSSSQVCIRLANDVDRTTHHTLTKVGSDYLLVGGKQKNRALVSCWLLSNGKWTQVHDLPAPRFRHCAVAVGDSVLIYGGVTCGPAFMLWTRAGWSSISSTLPSRVSACMVWKGDAGYLVGGMCEGRISGSVYRISLTKDSISFTEIAKHPLLNRFGAKVLATETGLLIGGGVSEHRVFDQTSTFVTLHEDGGSLTTHRTIPSPLLIGFELASIDNQVVVCGGGGQCWPYGMHWNESFGHGVKAWSVEVRGHTHTEFDRIYNRGVPHLFEKLDLGPCLSWTPDYLCAKLGSRPIVAHVTQAEAMNFHTKNFRYQTMACDEFVRGVFDTHCPVKMYLRSLSSSHPKAKPALFADDFPELAADVTLPPLLQPVVSQQFSSPLRISSPDTAMWLHYDVTANILCQLVGRKTVRLYPPSEVTKLHVPAGASSSTETDVFAQPLGPHGIEFLMRPGDVLFIPALWLHATRPLTPSISLNYFWKDLPPDLYSKGRDVYGNKDLAVYETGRQMVAKLKDMFGAVPEPAKQFYLDRLVEELRTVTIEETDD